MSFQAVAWVLSHSRSEGADRLVAVAIANRADAKGRGARPSVRTLVREARVSRSSVFRAIQELSRLGELQVVSGMAGRKANRYHLPLVDPQKELPFTASVPTERPRRAVEKHGCHPGTLVVPGWDPNSTEQSKTKEKTPRPTPARSNPPIPVDQRQKILAREVRVTEEVNVLRDNLACINRIAYPEEARRTVERIAAKMATLEPLSQAEYDRRRDGQKQKLREHLKTNGKGRAP